MIRFVPLFFLLGFASLQAQGPVKLDFGFPLPSEDAIRQHNIRQLSIYKSEAPKEIGSLEASSDGTAARSFVIVKDTREKWADATFDSAGRLVSMSITSDCNWDGSPWDQTFVARYAEGRIQSKARKGFLGNTLVELDSTLYRYSADGQRDTLWQVSANGAGIAQNGGGATWERTLRVLHKDASGQVVKSELFAHLEDIDYNLRLEKLEEVTFEYDAEGRVIREKMNPAYILENYQYSLWQSFTYTPNGKVEEILGRDCADCKVNMRTAWTYNEAGNPLTYHFRKLKISVEDKKVTFAYDENGLLNRFFDTDDPSNGGIVEYLQND